MSLGYERNPRGGVQVSHLLSLAPIPGPVRDAGFANTHTLGLETGPREGWTKKRKGWKREQRRGEDDECQRQHPRGGGRRAAWGRFTYRWNPISPSASWLAPGWARCFRWRRNKPKLPPQSLCARSPWLGQGAANGASPLPPPPQRRRARRRAPSSAPRSFPHRPRPITIDALPQQRGAPEPTSAPHSSRRRQERRTKKEIKKFLGKKKRRKSRRRGEKKKSPRPPPTPHARRGSRAASPAGMSRASDAPRPGAGSWREGGERRGPPGPLSP